jgi:hypothetical protein
MTGFTLVAASNVKGATAIAPSGSTSIEVGTRAQKATITVRTVPLKKSDAKFPVNWTWSEQIVAVQEIALVVNGHALFVPSSVYEDLIEPNEMSARMSGPTFVVEIRGADGAECYFVRIYFDKAQVRRRLTYSCLTPATPSEDTKYYLTEVR